MPTPDLLSVPRNVRRVLVAVFLLHLAVGAGVGLSVDEAHYALYAQHLALSYFDHPPLVGWVQWPLVALQAPTIVLRVLPGLLWVGTALLAYRLALRLGGAETGQTAAYWTVVVLAYAPLLHVLGIGLLPDTLLMFLTLAVMLQTLTLMEQAPGQRLSAWLWLGVGLGLAGLSKYTAIFAAVAVAVCLLRAQGWRLLRQPGPWLATLLAMAMVSPVVVWNAQNQWISFGYQAQHGAGSAWQFAPMLQFFILQGVVYGPLMLLAWAGVAGGALGSKRVLLAFFAIPFAILAVLAGGGSSLPHWTAPAWVALSPFAGLGVARWVQTSRRKVVWALLLLQGAISAGLLAMMVSAGAPLANTTSQSTVDAPNPFADLHGWDTAGLRAKALAQQHQLGSVSVQNWTLASRLGWYARPVPVHVLEDRFDQFDLWAGDLPVGTATLLVDWSPMAYMLPLGVHGFQNCALLDTQDAMQFGRRVSTFRFYACHGWSGDPKPQLKPVPKDAAP